ncbi:MAG TPA: hypothetical protein VI386_35660 [Candidatus Sulfotelmatobacter sp.]
MDASSAARHFRLGGRLCVADNNLLWEVGSKDSQIAQPYDLSTRPTVTDLDCFEISLFEVRSYRGEVADFGMVLGTYARSKA